MFSLLILLALVSLLCVRYCHHSLKPQLYYNNPDHCRSVMAAKTLPTMVHNKLNPYISKNLPSRGFRFSFAIDNAFTSTDGNYVKAFVKKAERLIALEPADWEKLSVSIHHAVRRSKKSMLVDGLCVPLTSMIQAPTMQAVLEVFFPQQDYDIKHDQLVALAKAINDAWIASKNQSTIIRFEDNYHLQNSLSAVFPDWNRSDPRENPLNWILPAFESMWRIVARTFIEIGFKTGCDHPEWRDLLVKFAKDPGKHKLRAVHGCISAESLVNEALRLYPPTKRVYRAWQWESSTRNEIVTADLEACHCLPEIWGATSKDFDPVRWKSLTQEQKNGFLPFGSAPFTCPAKAIFGPTMVALLVGALLSEFTNDWVLLRDDGEAVLGNFDLRNDRNALDEAILVCHDDSINCCRF